MERQILPSTFFVLKPYDKIIEGQTMIASITVCNIFVTGYGNNILIDHPEANG